MLEPVLYIRYDSFRVKLKPTPEQINYLNNACGCSRFIWNQLLKTKNETSMSKLQLQNHLNTLKKEYPFLKNVCTHIGVIVNNNLDLAFKHYRDGSKGHPKFKIKGRDRESFPVRVGYNVNGIPRFKIDKEGISISKMTTTRGGLGLGKIKYTKLDDNYVDVDYFMYLVKQGYRAEPYLTITNCVIYKECGEWYCSITYSHNDYYDTSQLSERSVGIDLGLRQFAVLEDGTVFKGLKYETDILKEERKLARLQRKLDRKRNKNMELGITKEKYENTKEMLRLKEKIAKKHQRIVNIRENYLHDVANKVVNLLPQRIVMEDLKVKNMMRNRHLARAIQRQSFYRFRQIIKYKAERKGIELVLADTFYASSKLCSTCNTYNCLKQHEKTYKCSCCGLVIDRDVNAAINLSQYQAQ